jgi:hypothetical protein
MLRFKATFVMSRELFCFFSCLNKNFKKRFQNEAKAVSKVENKRQKAATKTK